MKKLLSLLLLAATPLFANPFLVCPAVTSGISNSPVTYTVSGLPNSPIVSNAVTITSGTVQLDLDLGPSGQNVPVGSYTVSATATNPNGTSAASANFALTVSGGYVQSNLTDLSTSSSTVTAAYSSAQTAGDCNVVCVWLASNPSRTISSVTDTKGNTYTLATTLVNNSAWHASAAIYVAPNIAAATAGANTVTVTFSSAQAYQEVVVSEYSGIATSSPVDTYASASGNSTNPASGSLTTGTANDLLVTYYVSAAAGEATAPTGYTERTSATYNAGMADKFSTTTGSYGATWSFGTSNYWLCQTVALKP
jgi:hypothetical protein